MEQLINNIVRVEMIEAFHLRQSDYLPATGIFLNLPQFPTKIDIIGQGSCVVKDKIENNTRLFTSELTFRTHRPLLPGRAVLCFIFTTVQGERYLMGTHQRPFPEVTNTNRFPDKPTTPSGNVVKVTLTSTFSLLKVLD